MAGQPFKAAREQAAEPCSSAPAGSLALCFQPSQGSAKGSTMDCGSRAAGGQTGCQNGLANNSRQGRLKPSRASL